MRLSHAISVVALAATAGLAADKPADTLPKPLPTEKPLPKPAGPLPTVEMLVGTWELVEDAGVPVGDYKVIRGFTADGKATIEVVGRKEPIRHGSYTLDGHVLRSTISDDKHGQVRTTLAITRLTADTLEIAGYSGNTLWPGKFRRVPDKKIELLNFNH